MGYDYALVHVKYTIPPAIALSILYRPFFSRIDAYKISFLITIAVVATTPWDSYLIRRRIWTYPRSVIIGPTCFSIPAEEIFFFIIQTYSTTLLYLLLSKPLLHSNYLIGRERNSPRPLRRVRTTGQAILGLCIILGAFIVWREGRGTYLGLILVWAAPFAFLLWTLSYQFLAGLPFTSTVIPIAISTIYLWIVDTIALRRGTWAIESGTKLGVHVWEGLEIEEAIFFLVTNTLVVFGQVAFDNALAILMTFPSLFPVVPALPSPLMLVEALLIDPLKYDTPRIRGIQQASERLQNKSRSFYLASAVFSGRLRIDLILLYSFCRVADDFVDDASSEAEARRWIKKLIQFLDLAYKSEETKITSGCPDTHAWISTNFPKFSWSALELLPTHLLPFGPLYELLEGFKSDLGFLESVVPEAKQTFPIANGRDLEIYAARVGGTVSELCLELLFHHSSSELSSSKKRQLILSAGRMGIALQYVNIARDIAADAAIGRVYLPTAWLEEEGLEPAAVVKHPVGSLIEKLRGRILQKGFMEYEAAVEALDCLPKDSRAAMRVAVESYMEIGRVISEKGYRLKQGKATVPRLRRLKVAWKALREG